MAKNEGSSSNFLKSRTFIIVVLAALVLSIAIPVAYISYLDYLDVPNFVSAQSNYIVVSKDEASPGDTLTYIINLANEGRKEVTDVVVTTDIPEHTRLVSRDIDYLKSADDKTLSFLIGSLEVGQKKKLSFVVELDNPLDNETVISNNTLDITYRRSDSVEQINKKFETSLKTTVISSIDFSESYYKITGQNSEYLRMGDILNVVFFVKNSGNMLASDVTLLGIIPDNTAYVDGSFTSDSAYMDVVGGREAIRLDSVGPNEKIFINYSLEVSSGLGDNTRVVFEPAIEGGFGQTPLENKELMVRAFPQFDGFVLAGVDENGGDLLPNETIKYTVTFKNTGDGSAYDVFVENSIPENTTFIDSDIDPSLFRWEAPDRVFSVRAAELSPGEEFSYYYRVKVDGGLYYGTKVTNTSTLIYQEERLESESVTHSVVSNYSYNVAIMGDSQVSNTQWVGQLNSLFEQSYPYGSFNFIKSGRGGETVDMGYNRMLSSGILDQSPYIFIINYGTNDADTSSGYYRIAPETFRYYLGAMIDTIKTNTGAMVVVMSTGVVNEELKISHLNSDLTTYNNIASQICAERGAVFVDVFGPMLQSENPNQLLADGLHYNSSGDQLAARIAFNTISGQLNKHGVR
ncbi:MAG: GDSL-type esterase/lipase family protein [Actinomycetota bacterium]